jgi:glycosyltransferase involved in cell wall biosynthesis
LQLTLAITTYERPDALAAVLASVAAQRQLPHELLIADDGSGDDTRRLIERFIVAAPCPVRHVWQAHQGFRLTRLRNLAIAACSSDYLVFVDGDMLLHRDFVADHGAIARPGHFTQGVRIMADANLTRRLIAQPHSHPGMLTRGLGVLRRVYALHSPLLARGCRRIGNGLISIKGCNQGFWRDDLLRVNGFDEAIQGWGPEDKELCLRLTNSGVQRQSLLFGGIAWHLHHAPAARERHAANIDILQATARSRRTRCELGLDQHLPASL